MEQTGKKRSRLGLIIVMSVFSVLIFILIAALAILVYTKSNTRNPNENLLTNSGPLTFLDTEKIDPALALASLGGFPEAELIVEAIEKERPETALAGLLFNPELSDKESAGDFIFLAQTYAADNRQTDKAKFSYEMAGTIATLSPSLPDTVRSTIFLQAGEGLISLNEPDLAKFYLDQAFVVAANSPYLQAAHRRPILQQLQKYYIALNERELARQSLDLSANPPDMELLPDLVMYLPAGGSIAMPKAIQEAEANRWIRAQELAALLVERGGHAPPAAITALEEALLQEDEAKTAFFENQLAATTQVSEKIDLTKAKIKWLSIKYRVAKQGYGLSIVPEWEANAEQIRADLTKTYEKLYPFYADYIVALPEASQIDRATQEKIRREVLAGELGRYPNYPEEQRKKQLLDITEQLMSNQTELNVFLGTKILADQERYTLQTAP